MTLFRFLLLAVLLRLYPVLLAEMREGRVVSDEADGARCELPLITRGAENPVPQARRMEKTMEAFCQRVYVNMARRRNSQQRYEEAERAARQAVELRKLDLRARFELGVSLAGQRRNSEEAMENLRLAAAEIPEAHLELSRLFLEQGDFEPAMRELQAFRKTGKLGRRP